MRTGQADTSSTIHALAAALAAALWRPAVVVASSASHPPHTCTRSCMRSCLQQPAMFDVPLKQRLRCMWTGGSACMPSSAATAAGLTQAPSAVRPAASRSPVRVPPACLLQLAVASLSMACPWCKIPPAASWCRALIRPALRCPGDGWELSWVRPCRQGLQLAARGCAACTCLLQSACCTAGARNAGHARPGAVGCSR